jgi:uncharacterized protein (DUF697 family)
VPKRGSRIDALAFLSAVRGVGRGAAPGAVAVAGAPALVPVLARELRAGGDASAVREVLGGSAPECAALVWIGDPDFEVLRDASRRRFPIVAVTEEERVPYVFEPDVVVLRPGQGFPMDEIAAALARRLGDRGPSLAAVLPVLREAVVDEQIRSSARLNALLAAGVLGPGSAMRVLTLNQVSLVMRIGLARGKDSDVSRALGTLGVVGAGYGLRKVARAGLGRAPFAGWALRSAVAFGGTAAVGAVARRLFARDV